MHARPLEDLNPVAVCIPAHRDAAGLAVTLESIDRADGREQATVIVAIDGREGTASTRAVAEARADAVVVLDTNGGSYAARNAAIDAALAITPAVETLLFTDSDTVVDRQWIAAHAAALATAPRSAGAVTFTLSPRPSPAELVDSMRHLDQRFYAEALQYGVTANLAVRREVVEALRFDGSLRSGGDFEFGQRCANSGFPITYASDAVVYHAARSSALALLAKIDRVARGAAVLNASGFAATGRRKARTSVARAAAEAGIAATPVFLARAAALDFTCSLAFARRNPAVVAPALRRRIGRVG